MMKNEILEGVWRNRDEFARDHNYDIDAMVETLQEMEKQPLSRIIGRRSQDSKKHSGHKQKRDKPWAWVAAIIF